MMFKVITTRCFCTNFRLITPFIQLSEPGSAGIIILNRSKAGNSFDHEMSEYAIKITIYF